MSRFLIAAACSFVCGLLFVLWLASCEKGEMALAHGLLWPSIGAVYVGVGSREMKDPLGFWPLLALVLAVGLGGFLPFLVWHCVFCFSH